MLKNKFNVYIKLLENILRGKIRLSNMHKPNEISYCIKIMIQKQKSLYFSSTNMITIHALFSNVIEYKRVNSNFCTLNMILI